MKMNSKKILFALATFFILTSCTERIDLELDSTYTRCVIYGEITTDTTSHKVMITRSGDYFGQNAPVGISGAMVSISDGENVFDLTESDFQSGVYLTDSTVYGVPGRTYILSISNVDLLGDGQMKSYEAMSELRPVAKPASLTGF